MKIYSKTKSKSREFSLASYNIIETATSELAKHHRFRMQFSGQNMQPNLLDGDFITVEKVALDKIRPGDLILFVSTSKTALVQRVVKIDDHSKQMLVTTQADLAKYHNVPIPLDNILGRVSQIERPGRLVNLKNPLTRLLLRLSSFLYRLRRSNG
jgi:signal peptidase I